MLLQMSVKVSSAAIAMLVAVILGPGAGVAASPAAGQEHPAPAAEIAPISAATFDDMLADSVEEKGGVETEQGDTLRVELHEEAKVLFFTRPIHPAHPGIVAVEIVEVEGVPSIETSGWWAGDAQAFEIWFKAFERRNERLVREWQEE